MESDIVPGVAEGVGTGVCAIAAKGAVMKPAKRPKVLKESFIESLSWKFLILRKTNTQSDKGQD